MKKGLVFGAIFFGIQVQAQTIECNNDVLGKVTITLTRPTGDPKLCVYYDMEVTRRNRNGIIVETQTYHQEPGNDEFRARQCSDRPGDFELRFPPTKYNWKGTESFCWGNSAYAGAWLTLKNGGLVDKITYSLQELNPNTTMMRLCQYGYCAMVPTINGDLCPEVGEYASRSVPPQTCKIVDLGSLNR